MFIYKCCSCIIYASMVEISEHLIEKMRLQKLEPDSKVYDVNSYYSSSPQQFQHWINEFRDTSGDVKIMDFKIQDTTPFKIALFLMKTAWYSLHTESAIDPLLDVLNTQFCWNFENEKVIIFDSNHRFMIVQN
jgi:hypothetical protein